jgi:hypothetical protein
MQRTAPVVLVTVLVVLSGCSFLGGTPTPAPASPEASPRATPTDAPTPSATPTTTAASAGFPAGFGDGGVTDPDEAVDGHVAALEAAGSYLVEFNASADSSNRSVHISTLQAANLTEERAYAITTVADGANRTRYYAHDTVYVREDAPGEEPTYSSRPQPFEPRNFTGVTTVEPLVRNVEYGNATVRERDGDRIYVYRATGVDDLRPFLGSSYDAANVTSFDAGVAVGEDGVVRRGAYRLTVDRGDETVTVTVRINFLGFGTTNVEEPSWKDRAASS